MHAQRSVPYSVGGLLARIPIPYSFDAGQHSTAKRLQSRGTEVVGTTLSPRFVLTVHPMTRQELVNRGEYVFRIVNSDDNVTSAKKPLRDKTEEED